MTKYWLLLWLTVIVTGLRLQAQVSGVVTDASAHIPLSGAHITSQTGESTLSRNDGSFSLAGLPDNDTIVSINYVGYATQTLVIHRNVFLRISMEPKEIPLDEVSVTSGLVGNHLKSFSSSLNVITNNDIELRQHNNIADYINTLPGVYMASGSANTNKLTIRGIGSRSLYGTNRIKLFYNDIPISTTDGIATPEDFEVNNLAKIEVLKGSSSALYGSGLEGSVHVTTALPSDSGWHYRQALQYGSYKSVLSNTYLAYASGPLTVSGGYTYSGSQGYRQNSEFTKNTAFVNGMYAKHRQLLSASVILIDLNAQIPSSLNYDMFMNSPQNAAPNWLSSKGYKKYTKLISGISYKAFLPGSFNLKAGVFSNYDNDYEKRPFNILDDESFNIGFRGFAEYAGRNFTSLAGAEYITETYRWNILSTNSSNYGSQTAGYFENRFSTDLFQWNSWKPAPKLMVEFGFNVNMLHFRLKDVFNPDSLKRNGDHRYPMHVSPKVGINYQLMSHVNGYLSVSNGFSTPTVEETLLPDGQVNPGLKPETGWNLEVGSRGQVFRDHLYYDITLYQIFLDNLLVNKRVTEDIFTGINAGKTHHWGLECLLQYKTKRTGEWNIWFLDATASFWTSANKFKTFNDNGSDFSGKNLPGIPSQMVSARVKMQFWINMGFELEWRQTGSQFMNDANSMKYQSYNVTGLSLYYKKRIAKQNGLLFVSIDNIFNTRYASMILVNATSTGTNPPRYYYPGYPVNARVGIRLSD